MSEDAKATKAAKVGAKRTSKEALGSGDEADVANNVETSPAPQEKKPRRRKLTQDEKRKLLEHYRLNPKLKQRELAVWAKNEFDLVLEPSQPTISLLLKKAKDAGSPAASPDKAKASDKKEKATPATKAAKPAKPAKAAAAAKADTKANTKVAPARQDDGEGEETESDDSDSEDEDVDVDNVKAGVEDNSAYTHLKDPAERAQAVRDVIWVLEHTGSINFDVKPTLATLRRVEQHFQIEQSKPAKAAATTTDKSNSS